MTVRPLEHYVAVKPIKAKGMTPGGIALPESSQEKVQRGEVIAVGPGRLLETGERCPVGVNPGDTVIFPQRTGTEIDNDLLMLSEGELLATVS